jgi:glutamate N-acetyltransferase/amino-acid N-acetyltransferase
LAHHIEKVRLGLLPSEIRYLVDGSVTSPAGFMASALHAGIKSDPESPDLALLVSERPCAVAATFTRNRFAAAPVQLDRERIRSGRARGVLINSGNANACTGDQGLENARLMARWAADKIGASADEVLVASTGVIGVQLPMERIKEGLARLEVSRDGGILAARGIMTTDRRPKHVAVQLDIGGSTVRVGGMSKGAGMIHPDMATMLCFVTTDAQAEPHHLQAILERGVGDSFNMISIDGDTSTNDTCMLLANGASGVSLSSDSYGADLFQRGLNEVAQCLARAIVADGEGAERTMRVEVRGARSEADARLAARAVASSSLTKAALHGADPNWGRILCAVGYSGAAFDPERVELRIGRVPLVRDGTPLDFDAAAASDAMKQDEVQILVDLHEDQSSAVSWGCELTEAYVVENSAYTT